MSYNVSDHYLMVLNTQSYMWIGLDRMVGYLLEPTLRAPDGANNGKIGLKMRTTWWFLFAYCFLPVFWRGRWHFTESVVVNIFSVPKKTFWKKTFVFPTFPKLQWWYFFVELTAIFFFKVSSRRTPSTIRHQLKLWEELYTVVVIV